MSKLQGPPPYLAINLRLEQKKGHLQSTKRDAPHQVFLVMSLGCDYCVFALHIPWDSSISNEANSAPTIKPK